MYSIGVKKRFSAAHRLLEYEGKCERLHGHNWTVEVVCSGKDANDLGILIDFRDLKKALDEILEQLDHQCLNDLDPFKDQNPSSEHIARFVYSEMSSRLDEPAMLDEVRVWESEDAWTAYSGE